MTLSTPKTRTLAELADCIGATLQGDADCTIHGIAPLHTAQQGELSFLDNPLYRKHLAQTNASAVILAADQAEKCAVNALIVANPYFAFSKVAALYDRAPAAVEGIHPSAVIGESSQIHPSASVGANSVIGAGVRLDKDVVIGAGCVIGDGSQIGEGSRLAANVTLYHEIIIGKQCLIHSGVVLGADGFGIAKEKGQWHRIAQIGRVVIGDHVDIGASTTIDRGAIGDTVIEDGVKLDNQIQIGHNVRIGRNTAIAGCTAVAGSADIGRDCLIGGAAALNGHITIADNVMVTGKSSVRTSLSEPGVYSSTLAVQTDRQWSKNLARFRQLDYMARRLKTLEKTVENTIQSSVNQCEE